MSIDVKSVTSLLLVSFAAWYLLRRTTLGLAYTKDIWSIPQFFISFLGVNVPAIREGREAFRG